VVAALVIGLARGSKHRPEPLPQASASGATRPVEQRSFLERVVPPPPEHSSGPSAPCSISDLAKRLPLERQVAQLFLFGLSGKGSGAPVFGDLARLDIGGLVFGSANYSSPQQLKALTALAGNVARQQAARTLRGLGINGVRGPDVDVDTDPGGPYTNVAFSNDPQQVARFAAATVQAYLGAKMLTTPKHFPGLGAATAPTSASRASP